VSESVETRIEESQKTEDADGTRYTDETTMGREESLSSFLKVGNESSELKEEEEEDSASITLVH
jgi:hypothetical protein